MIGTALDLRYTPILGLHSLASVDRFSLWGKIPGIEEFLFFHQSPGDHQHLGRQLHAPFGFDSFFFFSTPQLIGKVSNKAFIPARSHQCRLIQSVADFGFTFLRDRRWSLRFSTLTSRKIQADHLYDLRTVLKSPGIADGS